MKKTTAVLLVLAMVLSFGSFTALAADETSLPEAADGVITLTENVALTSAAVFGEGDRVTLDLSGYTITGPDGGAAVVLEKGANLTVKDSSEAQSGAIAASGEGSTAVYLNGSGNTLRLQSGAIRSEGKESVAVFAKGDAQPENYASNAVQLRGGSVSAIGESAQAVLAYGSANFITVNGCAVAAEGDYVYGVALNPLSDEDAGGSQFTMTKGSVTVSGSRANAIYSEGPAAGKANSISVMEYGTTTVSASGTRANAIVAQNYNEVDISGGTISADNNALTANQKDTVIISGGTLSGAVGVNVACGSGGSVQFKEGWDGSAPAVQGSTAAVKAQYTWRGRSDDTAMIQITAGSFDGAITSDATKTGEDQDAYTYFDITGGSFSEAIEDSAYYNFAAAKGLTPGEYDKASETNVLEQREDGRYYIAEVSNSGYVLMNIPYAEFYAGEGVGNVDGVTSATKNKTRTSSLAGGSYHTDPAGTDISGVIYPVFVEDLSVLADFVQVTDETSVEISVTNRGTTTTTTFTGKDALFENADHAYYVLDTEPNAYKTLTVENGTCTFSATTAETESAAATVTQNYSDHHADVVLSLSSDALSANGISVNGVVITAKNADGTEAKYALRHVSEIWRVKELGWSWDGLDGKGLAGKTVTNVTYYLLDAEGNYRALSFDVSETIKLRADGITAAFDNAESLTVVGLPEDILNPVATVASKVGKGETPVVIAENVAVQDGKIACTDAAADGTTYTVTITSDNYADLKAETQYVNTALTGWQQIDGQWYYYDQDGTMRTSRWLKSGDNWYYLNSDGTMRASSWLKSNGKWYYMGASGRMQRGWVQVNEKWYYMNEDGIMQTGWLELGGKTYYLFDSGAMATGWQKLDGKWYYFNTGSGAMRVGWLLSNGTWYFMDEDGTMHTGWMERKGKWYFFLGNGSMVTGERVINGKTQLFDDNGVWQGRIA